MKNGKVEMAVTLVMVLVLSGLSLGQTAPMIWLNGEKASGTTATDQITADGLQNGTWPATVANVTNTGTQTSVTAVNSGGPFGDGYFNFPTRSYYATPNAITLPGVNYLGSSFTLSLMANFAGTQGPYQETNTLFSTYLGGGNLGHSFLFERLGFGNGTWTPVFQCGTGDTSYWQTSGWVMSPINSDGLYHQLAMTYNNGTMAFYYDGALSFTDTLPGANRAYFETTMAQNLQVGASDYDTTQLWGQVADVLVYNQALSAGDIQSIYQQGVNAWLNPPPPAAPMIWLNAEGDNGTTGTDKLTADGLQNGTWPATVSNVYNTGTQTSVTVQNSGAAFGNSCFNFPTRSYYATPNAISLPGINYLGSAFTLSLMANFAGTSGPYMDSDTLFSNYLGGGNMGHSLLFQRLGFGDGTWTPQFEVGTDDAGGYASITANSPLPSIRGDGLWHQLAMTYYNGVVNLYLDGAPSGSGTLTTARRPYFETTMAKNLQVGASYYDNTQLWGLADDIVVYNRALSEAEIREVYRNGVGSITHSGAIPPGSGWSQTTFPTGWMSDGSSNWTPLQPITLTESSQHSFEFIMPYFIFNNTDGTVLDYMDSAQAQGVKVMICLTFSSLSGQALVTAIQNDVNIVNNHPALYGYYLADEPDLSGSPSSQDLTAAYNAIKQINPNYPTFIAFSNPIPSTAVQPYLPVADVIAREVYQASTVSQVAGDVAVARSAGKKYLAIPGVYQDSGKTMTTAAQFSYLTFGSIAAGADGIMPFTFYGLTPTPPLPSNWRNTIVYSTTDLLQTIKPELLMGPGSLNATTNFTQGTTRIAGTATDAVLIAVNNSGTAQNSVHLTVSGLSSAITLAQVLGESRWVAIVNHVIVDNFAGQGVHVYKFTRYTTADLAAVLAAMDTANATVDKDGDGVITSSDLAIVLANLQ